MNKHLRQQDILSYYDGIQLFTGIDQLNTKYICVLVEVEENYDTYLCAPVSPARLDAFYHEEIDLRTIYTTSETDELFIVKSAGGQSEKLDLVLTTTQVSDAWLPDPGFLYNRDRELGQTKEEIIAESRKKGAGIIRLSFNPPEAQGDPKINISRLAEGLQVFQQLVKWAYHKAIREFPSPFMAIFDKIAPFNLQAYSLSPNGSITVNMMSEAPVDLVGFVEIEKALYKIDEITRNLDTDQHAIDIVKQNKGHLAGSYLNLLNFIVKNTSSIAYTWATPDLKESESHFIDQKRAEHYYKLLSIIEGITTERVALTGRLTKVDLRKRSWSLYSDVEKKTYNGNIPKENALTLKGTIMDSQLYRFVCEEKIEEAIVGQERTRLELVEYNKID